MTISKHLCVSISGLQKHLEAQDDMWQILCHDDGTFLSYGETWKELYRCQALGYDAIPGCGYVDKKGHCKGHPQDPEEKIKLIKEIIKGRMFMYEHQWTGEDKIRLCEVCEMQIERGTPCRASKYYNTWIDLNDILTLIGAI